MKTLPLIPLLSLLATISAPSAPALLAQKTPSATSAVKEEAVQLSVFEVTTSRDIGYQSTNAAEVTRMNTAIEDIPMNVTVFNPSRIRSP
jgi:hypothetical protein